MGSQGIKSFKEDKTNDLGAEKLLGAQKRGLGISEKVNKFLPNEMLTQ